MTLTKRPEVITAVKYEPGMEDGFGQGNVPFVYEKPTFPISNVFFCHEGDWIITHSNGTKEVMSYDRLMKEYQ